MTSTGTRCGTTSKCQPCGHLVFTPLRVRGRSLGVFDGSVFPEAVVIAIAAPDMCAGAIYEWFAYNGTVVIVDPNLLLSPDNYRDRIPY